MPLKNLEKLEDEDFVQFKGVLQSNDGGKTWVVVEQDAVVNVNGESLQVDMRDVVLHVAGNTDIFSLDDYNKFQDLVTESGLTDTGAIAKLLSFWYDERSE